MPVGGNAGVEFKFRARNIERALLQRSEGLSVVLLVVWVLLDLGNEQGGKPVLLAATVVPPPPVFFHLVYVLDDGVFGESEFVVPLRLRQGWARLAWVVYKVTWYM